MQFVLTEDQAILKESVTRMLRDLAEKNPDAVERRRAMAEFGLFQLGLDSDDPMPMESAIVAEAIGAALLPDGFTFSQLGAAQLLLEVDGQESLIAAIGEGEAQVMPALFEPGRRYALEPETTSLSKTVDGWVLNGAKSVVLCAAEASHFLVSAANADGAPCLVLVPANVEGVTRRDFPGLDGRDGAELVLENVALGSGAKLLDGTVAGKAIADLYDRVSAGLVAEAVGAMGALMEMTTEFLGTRRQFGVPIGTFQALQYRLVDMNTAYQLARSMSLATALALRDLPETARQNVVSSARVQAAESARHVGEEAIQLHGAMGMTEEYPAGRYFKRLVALGALYGDADAHLDRLAARVMA